MTTSMVMKKVGTADLKTHLSRYLDQVRQGTTFVVTDRHRPIARLVPIPTAVADLIEQPAIGPLSELEQPGPVEGVADILETLLEDRRRDR